MMHTCGACQNYFSEINICALTCETRICDDEACADFLIEEDQRQLFQDPDALFKAELALTVRPGVVYPISKATENGKDQICDSCGSIYFRVDGDHEVKGAVRIVNYHCVKCGKEFLGEMYVFNVIKGGGGD